MLGPQLRRRRIRSRQHNDAGAHRDPPVKVLDVLIGQTNAAGGHEAADSGWLIGAVEAVFSIAQIHRARAERIGLATSHKAWEVRLARDHLLWRQPVRPFFHRADALSARPGEAFAADAYAVTDRLTVTARQVKVSVRRVDNDGAGWLNGREIHDRAAELGR
jgi:hypothetical protein